MKRRMLALLTAMFLILGMPLQVLAATHDVSDFEGVQNAFDTDTDAEVTVNLTDSITWEYVLGVNEGQNYTVNGNGNEISGNVGFYGDADVTVNADIVDGGVAAMEGADVTVNGDISGEAGIYVDGSSMTVNGDVTVEAEEGYGFIDTYEGDLTVNGDVSTTGGVGATDATVVIDGNVEADVYVNAYNSDISVSGDVTADGVWSQEGSDMTIEGDVAATDVGASNADLTIGGNVTSEHVSGYNSNVTVDGNVDAENVYVDEDSTLVIEGDVTASDVYVQNSDATINGDVDAFLYAYSASVTVNGDVNGEHVGGFESDVTIEGDVNVYHGVYVENTTLTVGGDVTAAQSDAVTATNSTVVIGGNVTGGSDITYEFITDSTDTTYEEYHYGGAGVAATGGSVTVEGNVSSGDIHAVPGSCQPAVIAQDATVKIGGNVTGGSVILDTDPNKDDITEGGIGIFAIGSAVVEVKGNVTGGSDSNSNGVAGEAIYLYNKEDYPFTGKVTVLGTVTDGKIGSVTETAPAAPVITISPISGSEDTEIAIDVSVSGNEVTINELKADELDALLESLKKTVKEDGEGVSIDISVCKDATAIRIPVEVLKAIIENFGKLEIVFNGGVVTIDAAAFEKLVAENNFVTISLK